ncbi:hypothetical protein PF001_g33570 [Phytophthora fragariae]|uniref:Uncharacterized protein n=1 Tax=Phytophthora fragariae TaxID=53985 RepID=A0A6A3ZVX2_9STRA|nr:hypothetical protein PF001_g33570 [Phytophthora fragariae]
MLAQELEQELSVQELAQEPTEDGGGADAEADGGDGGGVDAEAGGGGLWAGVVGEAEDGDDARAGGAGGAGGAGAIW